MIVKLRRMTLAALLGSTIAFSTSAFAGAPSQGTVLASASFVPNAATRPAASSPPSTYVVFFGFDSSALTPLARQIVNGAASEASRARAVRILVATYADSLRHEPDNSRLSVRRAEAVKAELVRDGLHNTAVTVASGGFDGLRVATGSGVRERGNRQVVIELPASTETREASR